jgi:hypothetical protein
MMNFGQINLTARDEAEITAQIGGPWQMDPQVREWYLSTPSGERVQFQFRERGGLFVFASGNLAVRDARNPF